jgi:hypothetical protein
MNLSKYITISGICGEIQVKENTDSPKINDKRNEIK